MRAPRLALVVATTLLAVVGPGTAPTAARAGDAPPATPGAEAGPGSGTVLPWGELGDLVVDQDGERAYLTHDDELVAVDLADGSTTSIGRLWGAGEMSLSDDGTSLLVALRAGDAVAAVDTTTLEVTRYSFGPRSCPSFPVPAAGLVWAITGCGDLDAGLAAFDPATGEVVLEDERLFTPVAMVGDESLPDSLFVIDAGEVTRFDVGGGPQPTLVPTATAEADGARDLAFGPAGRTVVSDRGVVYRTGGLSRAGQLEPRWRARSVAVRGDGQVALYSDQRLWTHGPDLEPFGDQELGGRVPRGGLAYGGERLYLLVRRGPDRMQLTSIEPGRTSRATIELDRSHYRFGDAVDIRVGLGGPPPGSRVAVWATVRGTDRRTLVARAVTGPDRTVDVRTTARRSSSYTVEFDGDDAFGPASATTPTAGVFAAVRATALGSSGRRAGFHLYPAGRPARIAFDVRPGHPAECVEVESQVRVSGRWRRAGRDRCLTLGPASRGVAVVAGSTDLVGVDLRLRATFAPRPDNDGDTSRWLQMRFVPR